jgi:hypothetical protein
VKVRIPKEKLQEIHKQNDREVEVNRDMSLKEYDELLDSYGKGGVTTSVGDVESPWGISIATEFDTELMLEEINKSDPKVAIEITDKKLIGICKRFGIVGGRLNPFDVLNNLPYDDMIIDMYSAEKQDTKVGIRVIIDKSSIPSEKMVKKYHHGHSIGYFLIMSRSEKDPEEYYVGMRLQIENVNKRSIFTVDHTNGTFRVSDDPALRKEYRDKLFDCDESVKDRFVDSNGNNLEELAQRSIAIWTSIVTGLKNPEIREIWETRSREYSESNKPSTYVYNSKPLENIKRIYMCEPHHTGREITRHTDKWYVREHIAHSKYGKEFIRKGHYKGPKAKDESSKVEPRKRSVETWDTSKIDRDQYAKFMALLDED